MPPIETKPVAQKKPISLSPSQASTPGRLKDRLEITLDVEPAAVPPVDATAAVDFAGVPIEVGMFVDLYYCKVVGLRTSTDNRLNIVVVPGLHKIVTNDPENPLNGIPDEKGILVSGYHCISYPALADRAAKSVAAETILKDLTPDVPQELPSNFLTPSFS